jgi:hypothetical protein
MADENPNRIFKFLSDLYENTKIKNEEWLSIEYIELITDSEQKHMINDLDQKKLIEKRSRIGIGGGCCNLLYAILPKLFIDIRITPMGLKEIEIAKNNCPVNQTFFGDVYYNNTNSKITNRSRVKKSFSSKEKKSDEENKH